MMTHHIKGVMIMTMMITVIMMMMMMMAMIDTVADDRCITPMTMMMEITTIIVEDDDRCLMSSMTLCSEYVNNKLEVHHSKDYKIMTNDPPFDQQLKLTAEWKDVDWMQKMPGTFKPDDRFIRLTFLNNALPKDDKVTYL